MAKLRIVFSVFVLMYLGCNKKEEEYHLKSPVQVVIDSCGIPHIFAQSDEDAFYALGYIAAHYRLFQIDYIRREVKGELSEIFPEKITQDKATKILGIPLAGRISYEATKETGFVRKVKAFTDGINRYIDDAFIGQNTFEGITPRIPPQYERIAGKLGVHPKDIIKKFSPLDVVTIGKGRAFELSVNPVSILLKPFYYFLGKEKFYDFFRVGAAEKVSVVRDFGRSRISPFSSYFHFPNYGGSNNWVVSGRLTQYGFPLLANDPHLGTRSPSTFWVFNISSPEYSAAGGTFPGIPVVLVGGGENVCWGETVHFGDVSTIYLIKLKEENGKYYGKWGEKWEELKVIEEEIKARDDKGKIYTEKITFLFLPEIGVIVDPGPLKFKSYISDLLGIGEGGEVVRNLIRLIAGKDLVRDEEIRDYGIMLAWTGYKPTSEFAAFYSYQNMKNVFDAMNSARFFQVGSQNFIFADTEGNIAYYPHSEIPQRRGIPYFPQLADTDFWLGFLPDDFIPREINPEKGYIVTANNDVVGQMFDNDPTNERFYWGTFYDIGFRAKRIVDMIEENKGRITKETFSLIQNDVKTLFAEKFLKIFFEYVKEEDLKNEDEKYIYNALKNWDYFSYSEASTPIYFYLLWGNFVIESLWNNFFRMEKSFPVDLMKGFFDFFSDYQAFGRIFFGVMESKSPTAMRMFFGDDGPKDEFLRALTETRRYLENLSIDYKDFVLWCSEGGSFTGWKGCKWKNFTARRFEYIANIPYEEYFEMKDNGRKFFRRSGGMGLVYAADLGEIFEFNGDLDLKKPKKVGDEWVVFEQGAGSPAIKYICLAKPQGIEHYFVIPGGTADDPGDETFQTMVTAWAYAYEYIRNEGEVKSFPKIYTKLETDFKKLLDDSFEKGEYCKLNPKYFVFK